jgi:long-chain acyl-CoA synthetase
VPGAILGQRLMQEVASPYATIGEGRLSRIHTLNDLYLTTIGEHPGPRAFLHKIGGRYEPVSREEFGGVGTEIALGLVALGLERGERVALLSENRLEWPETDMGILTAALVSVPIYPTVTRRSVEHILEDSGARAVFVSTPEQIEKVRGYRDANPGFLVIAFEGGGDGILSLDEVRERGRALHHAEPDLHGQRAGNVESGDLATIIYTSGTTGPPKGVMLTHHNIVSNVEATLATISIGEDDTVLSFLPLSHILERMAGLYTIFRGGACIAYAESVETVAENMIEVRPTVMISVPRLYEKMYARVFEKAMSGGAVKRGLFLWAARVGAERAALRLARKPVPWFLEARYGLAARLVFSKLKARTGGRLRFFVSGGAPLAKGISDFFYSAGLMILEGYGLTESSPVLSCNTPEDFRPGTVGKPIPGVDIRIAEDGEILARGPNIMKGYYGNPEATAEVLQGGWLHTGDIGRLDEDGFLVITDRKKDILVTAGGKNVAPQPIENALKTDRFIVEAVVIGDGRPYLTALIVPDFDALAAYAVIKGLPSGSPAELARDPKIRDLLLRSVGRHQEDASSFETIKKIAVLDRDLSLEAGEVTPTMKVKRKVVVEKYASIIDDMYGS